MLMLVALVLMPFGPAVAKQGALLEPYVSPVLDAVLMPVTTEVVRQLRLPKSASGAVIVSVEPGGIADSYGMEPGEVISKVAGKVIRRPADIDALAYYRMDRGEGVIHLQGTREGRAKRTILPISAESYSAPLPVQDIPRWRVYSAPWFDFYPWYEVYEYEIVEIYEYSFYYVETVVVSEVFITSVESSESYFYYDYTEVTELETRSSWVEEESALYCGDVDGFGCGAEEIGYPEEDADPALYCEANPGDPECSGEEVAGYCDEFPDAPDCTGVFLSSAEEVAGEEESGAGDEGLSEEVSDEAGYDDASEEVSAEDGSDYADEAAAGDEGGYAEEEPVYDGSEVSDEGGYDESSADEGAYDEGGYDESATDEGTYEEPVYEDEPVYEEPAYEEPVYEEPAYEEPVYEEPVYEEPAYEEPAYEEPAYEEPSYDGGGGDCGYDEDGNPLC